jgi:hypothetical protein
MTITINKPENKVVNYLLSNSTQPEIISYYNYINGNTEETSWIEKANEKRENLFNIKCSECKSYINVYETGVCKCNNGHLGYNRILEQIILISV